MLAKLLETPEIKQCSYPLGYQDQVVYSCFTCYAAQAHFLTEEQKAALMQRHRAPYEPTALCMACAMRCHDGHDIFLIHRQSHMRCDCGNSRFPQTPCQLEPEKQYENPANHYSHNFFNRFCSCDREYNDESESMLQCEFCFDWFHLSHSDLPASLQKEMLDNQKPDTPKPRDDNPHHPYSLFYIDIPEAVYICKKCIANQARFLLPYRALWSALALSYSSLDALYTRYHSEHSERRVPSILEPQQPCIFELVKQSKISPLYTGKLTVHQKNQQLDSQISEEFQSRQKDSESQENISPEKEQIKPTKESELRKKAEVVTEEIKQTEQTAEAEQKVKEQEEESKQEIKEEQNETKKEEEAEVKVAVKEEGEKESLRELSGMVISLEAKDYCRCEKCEDKLQAMFKRLEANQKIAGKDILEMEDQDLKLETPLIPQEEDKQEEEEEKEGKQTQEKEQRVNVDQKVADMFANITSDIENQNQNLIPHEIKLQAAMKFKKLFEKFRTFVKEKEDQLVTETDIEKFFKTVEEDPSLGPNKPSI